MMLLMKLDVPYVTILIMNVRGIHYIYHKLRIDVSTHDLSIYKYICKHTYIMHVYMQTHKCRHTCMYTNI